MDASTYPYNEPLLRAPHGLNIALHAGLYLANIIVRHQGPHTALTIALHAGLYLEFIIDRHERPRITLTIALHGDLYIAIIMHRY
jgi:hypothetical protein